MARHSYSWSTHTINIAPTWQIRAMPLDCPPQPSATIGASAHSSGSQLLPQCLISTFGADGAGRRMEAALTCLAVAHDQGLQYIHTPFLTLQHSVDPARANEFLGLDLLSHCWPHTTAVAAAPRCGKCAPTKLEPGSRFAIGSKYIIEETGKQCSQSTSHNRSFLVDPRRFTSCDGRTVHCALSLEIRTHGLQVAAAIHPVPRLTHPRLRAPLVARRHLPLLRLLLVHLRASSQCAGLVSHLTLPTGCLLGHLACRCFRLLGLERQPLLLHRARGPAPPVGSSSAPVKCHLHASGGSSAASA